MVTMRVLVDIDDACYDLGHPIEVQLDCPARPFSDPQINEVWMHQ